MQLGRLALILDFYFKLIKNHSAKVVFLWLVFYIVYQAGNYYNKDNIYAPAFYYHKATSIEVANHYLTALLTLSLIL